MHCRNRADRNATYCDIELCNTCNSMSNLHHEMQLIFSYLGYELMYLFSFVVWGICAIPQTCCTISYCASTSVTALLSAAKLSLAPHTAFWIRICQGEPAALNASLNAADFGV